MANRYPTPPRLWLDNTEDEPYEPDQATTNACWDLSFGCTIAFGPNPNGSLVASVHLSDQALRDGCAQAPITTDDLRTHAAHLLAVADRVDASEGKTAARPYWLNDAKTESGVFLGFTRSEWPIQAFSADLSHHLSWAGADPDNRVLIGPVPIPANLPAMSAENIPARVELKETR